MKFYTNVVIYGDNALVRGVHNGQRFSDRIPFKPKLFVPKKKPGPATYHNLFGEPLESIEFGGINDAREFQKNYDGVSNMRIHGNTNWTYQYITENYGGQIEFDMNQLSIWGMDIETTSENGFPNVDNPIEEVQLITIQDLASRQITTWGLKPYTGSRTDFKYIQCSNEYDLLKKFLSHWLVTPPDIITGWNIGLFDIPYLVTRITAVMGEPSIKQLSPWRQVKRRDIEFANKTMTAFELVGVTQLDYLDLYKKFTYNAQESYKLDYICKQELGVGKLEHDYD